MSETRKFGLELKIVNKRKIIIVTGLCLSLLSALVFFSFYMRPSLNGYCAFCDSVVLDNQKFYEDDKVLALYTHKPVFPGHCLIISKSHAERFDQLSDLEIAQIGMVAKKVNKAVQEVFGTSSYLLLQKNGVEVGQSVPDVHFHYIPRCLGDGSALKFVLMMFLANAKSPISKHEIHENIEKLRVVIDR